MYITVLLFLQNRLLLCNGFALFLFTAPVFSFSGAPLYPSLNKFARVQCVVEKPNNFLFSLEMYAGNATRVKLSIQYDLGHVSMTFLHMLVNYGYGCKPSDQERTNYAFWITMMEFQDIDMTDYHCTMGNVSKKFNFKPKRKYYHILFKLYGQNVDVLFVKNNIKIMFYK